MARFSRFLLLSTLGLAVWAAGLRPATALATGEISRWDSVEIKVFQEDDLTTRSELSADGTLVMPLIGVVRLAGLSPEQAASEITRRLKNGYLVNPQVTVSVVSRVRRTVTVLGQVQNQGVVELPHNRDLTLVEAVGLAGGLTRIADSRKVSVKHSSGQVEVCDLKAISSGREAKMVVLREGDVVTVPESLF